jgi:tRNA threonylcarbamoyl adenosine modification protein YeaZ
LRILAIDTALEACSAAVLDTSGDGDRLTTRSVAMVRGHAEAVMPVIAAVMSEAGTEFADLDRIGVTVGPGSFTGLRVGVSAARALALASARPAVGVTTLAALAAPFFDDGTGGTVMPVIDARHDRVYMQVFGPGGRSLVAPRIATVHIAAHAALAGPTRVVGATRLIEAVWPAGEPPPALSPARAPDIAWVARLAALRDDLTVPVRPLYLSEADAHPQEAGILPRRR